MGVELGGLFGLVFREEGTLVCVFALLVVVSHPESSYEIGSHIHPVNDCLSD